MREGRGCRVDVQAKPLLSVEQQLKCSCCTTKRYCYNVSTTVTEMVTDRRLQTITTSKGECRRRDGVESPGRTSDEPDSEARGIKVTTPPPTLIADHFCEVTEKCAANILVLRESSALFQQPRMRWKVV
ncbi:hypothetical protein BaRGS_00025681 [Batillaria attramentaria]|uniref:Uncharacterized protein n=1 Tax=Batillaria attramentaria TaxID=370345 RepID=A0ABD0K7A7_9CAEN